MSRAEIGVLFEIVLAKKRQGHFPWGLGIRAAFSRIDGIEKDCSCQHVFTGGEQTKWYGSDSLI